MAPADRRIFSGKVPRTLPTSRADRADPDPITAVLPPVSWCIAEVMNQ